MSNEPHKADYLSVAAELQRKGVETVFQRQDQLVVATSIPHFPNTSNSFSRIRKSPLRDSALLQARVCIGLLTAAFWVFFASGQTSNQQARVSVNVLTNLPRGISLDEFTKQVGVKPTQQFAARVRSNDLICVSLQFERPRGRLYFLFANGKLTAIQDKPKVEFETKGTFNGKPWKAPKPVDPEQRMHSVVQTPDLSPLDIVQRFEQWLKNEGIATRGSQPENILPAFILTAPLFAAKEATHARATSTAAELAEKFDPYKVKLGMTAAEVETLFGTPAVKREEGKNCQLHVYGAHLPSNFPAYVPPVWISIVFCDDKVTRVFSNDFFDKRLIPERDGR